MEINELKTVWEDLTQRLEDQKQMTRKIVLQMTHEKTKNRLGRLIKFEMLSALNILFIVWIVINFEKLDNWVTQIGGVVSILIFGVGVLSSAEFIMKARKVNLARDTIKDTILHFKAVQNLYRRNLKVSKVMGLTILFSFLPVTLKIANDIDIFENPEIWWLALAICLVLCGAIFYVVYRGYRGNIESVNKLLDELQD